VTADRGGPGSATTPLERRYRHWLLAYPADYRRERGDELIGTLLDLADPGRRRPRPTEVAALLRSALAQRLVPPAPQALGRVLAALALVLALPPAFSLLASVAAVPDVCSTVLAPARSGAVCPRPFILNWVGWAWLAVLLAVTALPVLLRGRRVAVLAAVLATLVVLPALPSLGPPFLPSVVVTWLGAVAATRSRRMTERAGRGGRRAVG
jgi:hypothetical protein